MNKKLIAAILAATTALSAAPFALAENDENTNDKVEIAFNVGDSILFHCVHTHIAAGIIYGNQRTYGSVHNKKRNNTRKCGKSATI